MAKDETTEREVSETDGTVAEGAVTEGFAAKDAEAKVRQAPVADASAGSNALDADEDVDPDDDPDTDDSLTYSNGVIEKIVAMATREVPHVLGMKGSFIHALQEQFGAESLTKGVSVEVTDDNRVVVNISVIIEYGAYAPDIFEDVKERVTERLAAMTGLEVAGINLRIEDVVTPEEFREGQRHLAGEE